MGSKGKWHNPEEAEKWECLWEWLNCVTFQGLPCNAEALGIMAVLPTHQGLRTSFLGGFFEMRRKKINCPTSRWVWWKGFLSSTFHRKAFLIVTFWLNITISNMRKNTRVLKENAEATAIDKDPAEHSIWAKISWSWCTAWNPFHALPSYYCRKKKGRDKRTKRRREEEKRCGDHCKSSKTLRRKN